MHPVLKGLLDDNGLGEPDGRPLHAYRLRTVGVDRCERAVTRAVALGHLGISTAALFCLVTAHWFNRNYAGGQWSWTPIRKHLGIDNQNICRELTETGLGWWRRRVRAAGTGHGHQQFLLTLAAEGGLPVRLLTEQSSSIRRYVDRVIRDIETFRVNDPLDAVSIAENHDRLMPHAFRQDAVHHVVGELAIWVCEARRHIPDEARRTDPVYWLEHRRPDLFDTLPLDLTEEASRALLVRQLKTDVNRSRHEVHSLGERVLVRGNRGWQPGITLVDRAIFRSQGPLGSLAGMLDGLQTARLRSTNELARYVGNVMLAVSREDAGAWTVQRRSRHELLSPVPLEVSAEVEVLAEGRQLGVYEVTGTLSTNQPIVWQPVAGDNEQPTRLRATEAREIFTRQPAVYITTPGQQPATIGELEVSPGPGYSDHFTLWRLQGDGTVDVNGQNIRIKTSSDTEKAPSIEVVGPALSNALTTGRSPVYRASGEVYLIENEESFRRVRHANVKWRYTVAGSEWRSWGENRPQVGKIEVEVLSGHEPVARKTIYMVPDDSKVIAFADNNGIVHLEMTGFYNCERANASHGSNSSRNTFSEGSTSLTLDESSSAEDIVLTLLTSEGARLNFLVPCPASAPGFVTPSQTRAGRDQKVSTSALAGWQAVAPADQLSELRLRVTENQRLDIRIYRRFTGRQALLNLQEEIETVLAAAGPDASARLRVLYGGTESQRLYTTRFDAELRVVDSGNLFALVADESIYNLISRSEQGWIDLEAVNVLDPQNKIDLGCWYPLEFPQRALTEIEKSTSGPWLIVGSAGPTIALRPAAVRGTNTIYQGSSFTRPYVDAALCARRDERIRAFAQAFGVTFETEDESDWANLETLLDVVGKTGPVGSLDLAQALSQCPAAACLLTLRAQDEPSVSARLALDRSVPLFWSSMPVSAWMTAINTSRSDLIRRLNQVFELSKAQKMSDDDLVGQTQLICNIRPELAGHLVASLLHRPHLMLEVGKAFPDLAGNDPQHRIYEAMARAIKRNAETGMATTSGFEGTCLHGEQLEKFDARWQPLLKAPLLAAEAAAGRELSRHDRVNIEALKAADPVYFAEALPSAVLFSTGVVE